MSYARQDFAIFPCWPNEKRPLTPHGFKDATCDEKQISRWWKQWPTANIGLALDGKFWVLDVDNPDGEQSLAKLESQHEPLPLTTQVRTGHGGRHIYFSAPSFKVKTTAGKLGHGIDIRGASGYVLVPPSYTVAEYVWISRNGLTQAPEWLLALTKGPLRASHGSARPQDPKRLTPLSRAYARSVLNGELAQLRQAVPGERNYRLNRAAFRLGQLIAIGSLDRVKVETRLTKCALATGLVLEEIKPVIQSALSAGAKQPMNLAGAVSPTNRCGSSR
jgi:hypothetical protein